MDRIFKRNRVVIIILGVAFAALGAAVIARPEGASLFFTTLVGWGLVAIGVIQVIGSLIHGIKEAPVANLVVGGAELILGILVVIMPQVFAEVLFAILGVVVVLAGIATVVDALSMRKLNAGPWVGALIWGIITFLIGCVMVAAPFAFAEFAALVSGLSLVITGTSQAVFGSMLPTLER